MMSNNMNEGTEVKLYIYDLTKGMAKLLAPALLEGNEGPTTEKGKQIGGVWHTGVVAYGREYFFGHGGIESCNPGGTILGEPEEVKVVGETQIPYSLFLEYIFTLGESSFRPGAYDLFKHNCNIFSNELSQFLCGIGVPDYILKLPDEVLDTPLGQTLRPLLDSLSLRVEGARGVSFGANAQQGLQNYNPIDRQTHNRSPELEELAGAIEEVRQDSIKLEERRQVAAEKAAEKERKKEKKKNKKHKHRKKQNDEGQIVNGHIGEMSEADQATGEEAQLPPEEPKAPREPPIIFPNLQANEELEGFARSLGDMGGEDAQIAVGELEEYAVKGEGAWALSDETVAFIGRILHEAEFNPSTRVALLRLLACVALKDDIILLLHQDRRTHMFMNFAVNIDRITIEEQEALATFMCNLFETNSASEWLLYISEWQTDGKNWSNIQVTTKVAVHALLSELPAMQDVGTAMMYNLAGKEVFDDVATELAMAILQFLGGTPSEESVFRALKALLKFSCISHSEVPTLIQMIGPHPSVFKGMSPRVDEFVEEIEKRIQAAMERLQ